MTRHRPTRDLASLALLVFVQPLAACGDDGPGPVAAGSSSGGSTSSTGDPTPVSTTTASTSTDGGSTSGTTAGATTVGVDDTGTSTDGGTQTDTGDTETTGPAPSCSAVDILVVIDNSLSMGQYQTQLASVWPSFVDALWGVLPEGVSVHVGMTTTSFFDGSCSESVLECVTTASPQTIADHYIPPTEGNTGVNGEQGRLFEWDGRSYFEASVGDDPAELATWCSQAFTAAGEAGCSFEMMSAAAGYAFHPANVATNGGFVRDEGAVLAILVLTDEPDKSPEGVATYSQMVLDAKAGCGGDGCVVVTGIYDQCIEEVDDTLWQLFSSFSSFAPDGDIDEPADYQIVMDSLAEAIAVACEGLPKAR